MTGRQRFRGPAPRRRPANRDDRRPVQDQSLEDMQRDKKELERRLQARRIQRGLEQARAERDIEDLESHHQEDFESQVDEAMSNNSEAFMKRVRQPGGE